jgi:antitoxin HicB
MVRFAMKNQPSNPISGLKNDSGKSDAGVDIQSGSSFGEFLEEEGYRDEVESIALKRVLAWQFKQEMVRQQKTKSVMAAELKTSRSQLDRLLDPKNTAVSLEMLMRAARVLGKCLVLEIRDVQPKEPLPTKAVQRRPKVARPIGRGHI